MGFRFFRRMNIAPGVRLNFSKSGVSPSFGVRGARATIGRHGIRRTVGIPGTGLFYTEVDSDGSRGGRSGRQPAPPLPEPRHKLNLGFSSGYSRRRRSGPLSTAARRTSRATLARRPTNCEGRRTWPTGRSWPASWRSTPTAWMRPSGISGRRRSSTRRSARTSRNTIWRSSWRCRSPSS